MSIPRILKYFALCLPFLEIAMFILVGSVIGVIPVLFLVIASILLGGAILRGHGFLELNELQQRVRQGYHPTVPIMENALILLAGFLFIIPGFITDIIALLLLSGRVRITLINWLASKNVVIVDNAYASNDEKKSGTTIEGEFWREDDDHKP